MDVEDTTTADRGIANRVLQVHALQHFQAMQKGLQRRLEDTMGTIFGRGKMVDGISVYLTRVESCP